MEIEPPAVDAGALRADPDLARRRRSTARPQIEDKLERQDRHKAVEEAVLAQYAAAEGEERAARAPSRRPARLRQAREGHHPAPDRRRQAPSRRPRGGRDPRGLLRGGHRAPHARLGALHARPDPGLHASRRSAPAARSSASTRSGSRRPSATSTTTTSRPSRSGRPASCAARSAATSVTARSPSGRCFR